MSYCRSASYSAKQAITYHVQLQAGAEFHPTLSPAHIIIGIKETPLDEVLTDALPLASGAMVPRTHIMFSHTHKGQLYNMELLSKFLQPGALSPRLIDYELLTDEDGRRTVGFGWFAGGEFHKRCIRASLQIFCPSCWGLGVIFGTCSCAA